MKRGKAPVGTMVMAQGLGPLLGQNVIAETRVGADACTG
jgi:hypothetical protein